MREAAPEDPWFWSHYRTAATIVTEWVPGACLEAGKSVLDFGCGDGAMALGMASRTPANVLGVDLFESYHQLPKLARDNLSIDALPRNLSFQRTAAGQPLPFSSESIDLVYSWSVFEHLADVRGTLCEFRRIVRPGGTIFIQIEPLYFGPFGSHLQRLVDEPWAHLIHDEREFLRMAESAADHVPESEKDILYRTHAFEDVKRHLLGEYKSLNRIRADELLYLVQEAGFEIEKSKLIRAEELTPGEELLEKYPPDLLLTNQVVLTATRGLSSAGRSKGRFDTRGHAG